MKTYGYRCITTMSNNNIGIMVPFQVYLDDCQDMRGMSQVAIQDWANCNRLSLVSLVESNNVSMRQLFKNWDDTPAIHLRVFKHRKDFISQLPGFDHDVFIHWEDVSYQSAMADRLPSSWISEEMQKKIAIKDRWLVHNTPKFNDIISLHVWLIRVGVGDIISGMLAEHFDEYLNR
ncbi:MAG: hypothetical protein HC888_00635 [Candidatus Competibacteraceae bacterium]|nr:hypothetical protein [Candidatus Competibacteraceae bacterium]